MDLETQIRAIVRDEIARTRGAEPSTVYATKPRGAWPPGARSDRSARDRIRAVPGHVHAERGLWTVTRELYARHHAAPVLRVAATSTDEELADRAIAAAGLRSTRRIA